MVSWWYPGGTWWYLVVVSGDIWWYWWCLGSNAGNLWYLAVSGGFLVVFGDMPQYAPIRLSAAEMSLDQKSQGYTWFSDGRMRQNGVPTRGLVL